VSAPATVDLETLCINTIRGLSIDGVQAANSGHPGLPMGAAPMAFALWTKHLRHNPHNPHWFNRDRFILSAGHGSMLLYSLLHLTGYDLPLEELKHFRQLGSKTPGHPEYGHTIGIETTTGPLGQGLATSVGFAIAEKFLGATFNKPGHDIIDHFTYGICSDGDLMEGVSNEAGSLAGHLELGKLIFLYDSNHVTIDGRTDIAFTEDVGARFEALGWHVQHVDGMNVAAVDRAIQAAKDETKKPSMLVCRTIIGYGSPNKSDSSKVHGSPLGEEELKLSKLALGIPLEPKFYVADEALTEFRKAVPHGKDLEDAWDAAFKEYDKAFPEEADALSKAIKGDLGDAWIKALPVISEKIASRASSGKAINAIAPFLPTLIGGSADLAESNNTHIEGSALFQPETPAGRNLCFGIREHAMAAAINGITLHGGCRAYGASFLIFTDYCRPALRLAALMGCPSIFVFTHDSIGLGEDGPTHQPIEQLASLRAIPNFNLLRPADGNETVACWKIALETHDHPCLMALTRQGLPPITPNDVQNHPAEKGAYILTEATGGTPKLILVATGSEVSLAMSAKGLLEKEGTPTRVVSFPSWFLFERQPKEYRNSVLPKSIPTVSIEAASPLGWDRYSQAHVAMTTFGASGKIEDLMKHFGFTPENVAKVARELLDGK
jgi:transketolase